MGTPYLAEIRLFSFNFPPKGWAMCNGQFLPINQNQALFSILGTTYGGNGTTTFALPDLRGRVPFHFGNSMSLGQRGGEEFHTLLQQELPQHLHPANASHNAPTLLSPANAVWATHTAESYAPAPNTQLSPQAISNVGGSQAHENRSPYLVLNFGIALQGIFPSRN